MEFVDRPSPARYIVSGNLLDTRYSMKCPSCSNADTRVVDKRNLDDVGMIRRRRECLSCGKRFTTHEKIDMTDLMVLKKDGRREPFDAEKLKRGLMLACKSRPINMHEIDGAVAAVESTLREKGLPDISSDAIGNEVIGVLQKLDKVACVRFASVYKSFQSVGEFESEVKRLLSSH